MAFSVEHDPVLIKSAKSSGRIPAAASALTEAAASKLVNSILISDVIVPEASVKAIPTTYAYFPSVKKRESVEPPSKSVFLGFSNIFGDKGGRKDPALIGHDPIVLIHGFDSSCVEFRRIAPILAEGGRDVYVLDILGWGFNDHSDVSKFGPDEKMAHLQAFVEQVVLQGSKGKAVVAGASLGGALAITLAVQQPNLVSSLVLIDAQGFIDGDGPKEDLPDAAAKLGIAVLRSWPLRMFANIIAYSDRSFATWEAMNVGRLHCDNPSWERASVAFLKSGGFVISRLVGLVRQPTLVLWGENDGILELSTAERFREELLDPTVVIVPDCGHVPHLEKPAQAAKEILDFVSNLKDKL
jgi:pimeloyl-ACP methyl ester carboxylesterase